MRKIFVNEHVEMFEYGAAEPLLQKTNDLLHFNEKEQGIHKVPKDRWSTAQNFERRFWMEKNPSAKDDRNFDHFEKFDSFKSVQDKLKDKKSVIELGCGPFTNLRLMTNMFVNPQLVVLDPLINDYLNLEHCTYKDGTINNIPTILANSTIEEFQPENRSYEMPAKFDVVIMINVIEHCFDVDRIFKKILDILNKDGIFIFADVYFNDVKDIITNLYDAGHPLHLSEEKMNTFLKKFKILYDKRFHGLYGQEWRNDIYFIGSKK